MILLELAMIGRSLLVGKDQNKTLIVHLNPSDVLLFIIFV